MTQDTTLWGSYVQDDGVGGELAHFHHLRSAGEEILNHAIDMQLIEGQMCLCLNKYIYIKLKTA